MRIDSADLTPDLLNRLPLWTWYDGTMMDSEDLIRPVSPSETLDDSVTDLFIAIDATLANGYSAQGYVVYDIALDEVRSIALWIDSTVVSFSRYVQGFVVKELERLGDVARRDPVFPIAFEAKCELLGRGRVRGRFEEPLDRV